MVSIISRMCVSCPGYIASHPTDNVHAMQGVRPFCGLISHFFPAKIPSCARVHFRNWPCHLVLWTVPSVTISISKPLFRHHTTRLLHFLAEEKIRVKEWELNDVYLKLVVFTVFRGGLGDANRIRYSQLSRCRKHCLLKSVSMSCQPLSQFCLFSIAICNHELYTVIWREKLVYNWERVLKTSLAWFAQYHVIVLNLRSWRSHLCKKM